MSIVAHGPIVYYFSEKIRLGISCESSVLYSKKIKKKHSKKLFLFFRENKTWMMGCMKHQVLFSSGK